LDSPPVFENRAFHEAAHGVAAVEMGMVAIDLRIGSHLSPRNIDVDGSTGYGWPILENESGLELLQRRMVVILAGIAWEEFSTPRRNRVAIIRRERDDTLAAFNILREVRKRHELGKRDRREWLTQAWERAKAILREKNSAIIEVGLALSPLSTMDDSTLRSFVASATLENNANPDSGLQ